MIGRKYETFFLLIFLPAVWMLSAVNAFAEAPLIPREDLFGNPEKSSPQISPDGKMISYLAPSGGVLNIWIRTIGKNDDRPVTADKVRGIRSYFWANDSRQVLYLQDIGGNENWSLYGVDIASMKSRHYTPYENVQVRVVGADKHIPDRILISMNKDDKKLHDVYSLSLTDGSVKPAAKNTGDISEWVSDRNLRVLGAVKTRPDGGTDFLVRDSEDSPWRLLASWSLGDGMENGPLEFTKDGKSVYLRDSSDSDKGRLKKMNLANRSATIIAEDPEYDLGGVMFDPETYEPQVVSFEKEKVHYTVLDPSIQADMDAIAKIDEGEFSVASRDDADKLWLVGFSSDRAVSRYYVYDRRTKKAVFLFKTRTTLDRYTLAAMEPMQFTSSDGYTIHGYITFPPGEKRTGLPMVLNVHGGPWARESWGYHPQAQWLANRGYICLQVNFRGSTGYGKKFVNAADREWGGSMQRDLTEAVKWAVDQGYADPKKIAIYGGSYGGYASLAGAAFTPDLYCCAVDIVGPSNLLTFLNTIPPYWEVYRLEFYKRVGNPATEEALLKSRSPFFHADSIKIPLFIAQGANDPRVNEKESEQIVSELQKRGISHEYLLFPDEGHGFARPENRLKFYAACERFLARHLGGRFEEGRA